MYSYYNSMDLSIRASKLQDVVEKLEKVVYFLDAYLPLASAHNTDFILQGHWRKMVPPNVGLELLSLSDSDLAQLPKGDIFPLASSLRDVEPRELRCSSHEDSVAYLKNSTSLCDLTSNYKEASASPNSGTEVEVNWTHSNLEEFVLAARANTLPYLDILTDVSSFSTTVNLVSGKGKKNCKRINKFMSIKKSYEVEIMGKICSELVANYDINKVVDVGCGLGYLGCHLVLNHDLRVLGIDSSETRTYAASIRTNQLKKQWLGLIKNMQTEEESVTYRRTEARSIHAGDPLKTAQQDAFRPVAHFVTNATNLDDLFQQHFPSSNHEGKLMLTGLHTCGDLSPNLIRLFLSNSSSQVLCKVGCCYNLMTEKFLDNSDNELDRGFPLSQTLMKHRFYLGSNARMLAAQSTDRLAHNNKIPSISLYWRSLLQVLLSDCIGEISDSWCVGKIASKCNSFNEYVQKALQKLKISHSLPDAVVDEYVVKYSDCLRKLQCFYQLRTCLGPCIETLILLDRLAFLLEQSNIQDAYLVQLFNPVTSPRCYAVVALKHVQ